LRTLYFRVLACWALPLFLADQTSKVWVVGNFPEGYVNHLLPNLFAFVHWRNPGAAWGMFAEHTWVLALVSLAALLLMILFLPRMECRNTFQRMAVGLILGGIAGNLIDRVFRGLELFKGTVVDFLFFYHNSFQWPAFNIADSVITVGVTVYCVCSLFASGRHDAASAS